MDRLQEIEHKHQQIRGLLAQRRADALWLRMSRNIAWFTAGADATIPVDTDGGAYSILVTADERRVYTTNIEATRIHAEEKLEDLGFAYHEFPWYAQETPDVPHLLTDADADNDLRALRLVLTESEIERYRALGQDTAAAIDEAARAVRPGDTEFEIAARLDAACRARGGMAVVNLIATDERISSFRHPKPTMKPLDKYAMLVVCNRRGGLIVSATRLVHIGPMPAELEDKSRKVAAIDAAVIAATRPGRSHAEIFADLQAAYMAQGEADQWQNHHQGGPTSYQAREAIATPDDLMTTQANMAYAWNPSVVGCKSEDTFIVTDAGFEIISAAPDGWPSIEVSVGDHMVRRPGILAV